jgi:hypothetical protein
LPSSAQNDQHHCSIINVMLQQTVLDDVTHLATNAWHAMLCLVDSAPQVSTDSCAHVLLLLLLSANKKTIFKARRNQSHLR